MCMYMHACMSVCCGFANMCECGQHIFCACIDSYIAACMHALTSINFM